MKIIWLSVKEGTPARGYWDQRLLEGFFEGCDHTETDSIPEAEEAIVVIPGAYQAPFISKINQELAKLKKCTVVITSDEENNFPLDDLKHPNMRVFANYYNSKYKSDIFWLPIGPANVFTSPCINKGDNFVFIGQVTHPKREGYVQELRARTDGLLIETKGFAQGLSPDDYYKALTNAKTVPSPAGNISPDAFRTYEAIHAGAVPIPTDTNFHNNLFGFYPFPVVDEYEQVNGYMDDAIGLYPAINNRVQAWWLQRKRLIKKELLGDRKSVVTAMVPCSPIKSHPDISIIDETIKTIVGHLPDAEIIVTFDGVRKEQADRKEDYEEFKRRFLWECYNNPTYKNVLPVIFDTHMHQVKMAREALQFINSDNVLYVEQDTPLTPDQEIDWQKCFDFLDSGEANLIRFHFEAHVPEEHKHLMLGNPENGFLKTYQWSQRPHLISTPYFESILDANFSPNAVCFIEDKMHGVVQEVVLQYGMRGWMQHRIWIYHPDGNIKRSYHTDGRANEDKWDNTQKW